jgi:hypothetical protein
MKEIAKKKANEERKRLESEVIFKQHSVLGHPLEVLFFHEDCLILVDCNCICAHC